MLALPLPWLPAALVLGLLGPLGSPAAAPGIAWSANSLPSAVAGRACAPTDHGAPARSAWQWPVSPAAIAHGFEPPALPWGSGHRGVDLSATVGAPVRSPAAGTVTFAGAVAGRPVLVVGHPSGLRSTLEPVTAVLAVGASVAPGAIVGSVAPTAGHCSPGTCVHWGVLRGTTYLDPLALGCGHVILLPLA